MMGSDGGDGGAPTLPFLVRKMPKYFKSRVRRRKAKEEEKM